MMVNQIRFWLLYIYMEAFMNNVLLKNDLPKIVKIYKKLIDHEPVTVELSDAYMVFICLSNLHLWSLQYQK